MIIVHKRMKHCTNSHVHNALPKLFQLMPSLLCCLGSLVFLGILFEELLSLRPLAFFSPLSARFVLLSASFCLVTVCVCVCVHAYVCMCVCACACECVCVCVCTCMNMIIICLGVTVVIQVRLSGPLCITAYRPKAIF